MYRVAITREFSSAHSLREYMGKCEALHGHNWKVEIVAESETLDRLGMVLDFTILKAKASEVLEPLDHAHLNELAPFDTINPSSENLAKYIFDEMSARVNDDRVRIAEVSVWESGNNKAIYWV